MIRKYYFLSNEEGERKAIAKLNGDRGTIFIEYELFAIRKDQTFYVPYGILKQFFHKYFNAIRVGRL